MDGATDLVVSEDSGFDLRRTIKVRVGLVGVFVVHEALITQRSKFFKAATKRGWKESEDRVVKFPYDRGPIFKLYLQHLYRGDFPLRKSARTQEQCELPSMTYFHEVHSLCDLYVLAEKLQDVVTKNAVVDAIIEISLRIYPDGRVYEPDVFAVKSIYEGTPGPNPCRRMLVDLYCHRYYGKDDHWLLAPDVWPKDFFVDMMKTLINYTKPYENPVKDRSKYHETE